MTLLSVVSGACERLGLTRPAAVATTNDQTISQILGLAQEEGKDLVKRHTWQALQAEHTFPTVNGTESYALPSDFDAVIKDTVFNRTRRRRMVGDLTPDQWQQTKSSLVTMVNPAFRIRGSLFLISPTPNSIETVAYEYLSKNWVLSASLVGRDFWAADTDTSVLDEEVMTLGIKWRWKKAKGLDYAEDFNSYENRVAKAILDDGARVRIQTDNVERDRVPHAPQVPETLVF